jgi:DnaJ-class molecular chaperone
MLFRPRLPVRLPRLSRLFSGSSDAVPNHYETLNLPSTASKAEIKKRFYELSKTHHPDRARNDPHAAKKFIKISSAYSVLSNPKLREKYDREILRARGPRTVQHSNPVGGRPASGLRKRPPPAASSAFRNTTGFKRHSTAGPHPAAGGAGAGAGSGPGGGMGYGAPGPAGTDRIFSQHEAAEKRRKGPAMAVSSLRTDILAIITVSGILWFTVWSAAFGGKGGPQERKNGRRN